MKPPVFYFHTAPRLASLRLGHRRILAVSCVPPCYRAGVLNPPSNPWAATVIQRVRLACRRAFPGVFRTSQLN
jgi:hypothetical protein